MNSRRPLRVYSEWQTEADTARMLCRQMDSLLWWVLCSSQFHISRLGYRGYWKHLQRLQTRHFWYIYLPHYGMEQVTWWHVFGLRRFDTPVPLKIVGESVEFVDGHYRHRFWWNVA